MIRPLALLGAAVLLVGSALAAGPVADSLPAIRAVDHEGRGNTDAARAWRVLAAADAEALPEILAGMDGANPLAANWLRAAVDAVVARHRDRLPLEALVGFLGETSHDPRARRLAFDLVRSVDAARADTLLDAMLDDPSVELRRDAVARAIEGAKRLRADGPAEGALDAYRRAFAAARDPGQVREIATAIRELGGSADLREHFGFLTAWRVVGPFDNAGNAGFARAYPPEEGVDPAATYDGKEGKVSWRPVSSDHEEGIVNVNLVYPPPPPPADAPKRDGGNEEGLKGVLAYAVTDFVSAAGGPAELRLGCKNAWKIWLNGQPVFERDEYHRGMEIDQYRMPVELRPGRNEILVKLCQDEQRKPWTTEWEFQLRVCDAVGTAIPSAGAPAP